MINKVVMFWSDEKMIEAQKKHLFDSMNVIEPSNVLCNCKYRVRPIIRKIEFYEIWYSEQASKAVDKAIKECINFPNLRSFLFHSMISVISKYVWLNPLRSWFKKVFTNNEIMNSRNAILFDKPDKLRLDNAYKCPNCGLKVMGTDI